MANGSAYHHPENTLLKQRGRLTTWDRGILVPSGRGHPQEGFGCQNPATEYCSIPRVRNFNLIDTT